MSLALPPPSKLAADTKTAQLVHDELTSVIAGNPRATTTYQFYEELDAWLGPWGPRGYPIGYGKFYNRAFTTHRALNRDPLTRWWVWKTAVLLQRELRDYVVGRVRDGTLGSLTERELRKAAFQSHAKAYDRAGLAGVALVAPQLVPVIATIPAAEFLPTSRNFVASVCQVFETFDRVAPQVIGMGSRALAARLNSRAAGSTLSNPSPAVHQ